MILELYFTSISANTFCLMCWWAWKSGMPGSVAEFAMKPGSSSGNYQKKLNKVLSFDLHLTRMYDVQVPGYPRREAGRGPLVLPLRPPHELIEEEASKTPRMRFRLREAIDAGRLPPAYMSHPVVAEATDPPLPVALYCDSVSYTRADSMVGVRVINLITGLRHTVGLLRKAIVCR